MTASMDPSDIVPVGRGPGSRTACLAACLLGFFGGCDACDAKPHTPYTLEPPTAASPSPDPPALDAGPATDGGTADAAVGFVPIVGLPAPADGKSWPLGANGVVPAPTGRMFSVGQVIDFDGDSALDLLAWARSPDGLRGELWYASGARPEAGRPIAALPGDSGMRACETAATLNQVGSRTMLLDVSFACRELSEGKLARWLAIVRWPPSGTPKARPELAMEVRLGAPPPKERVAIGIDGSDVDADGRDDVTASITLSGSRRPFAQAPAVTAQVRFFDRAAGLSGDAAEPEASLRSIASGLAGEARRKATAPGVAATARQLRRLTAALCGERPLVSIGTGRLACSERAVLEDIDYADALAAVALDDPLRAIAATSRLGDGPSASAHRKEIDKALAKRTSEVAARALHTATAVPTGGGASIVSTSPLAFEHAGHLLVRTSTGVVRIDASTVEEAPAPEVTPWPVGARLPTPSAGDVVLTRLGQDCDTGLVKLFSAGAAQDSAEAEVVVPIATPIDGLGFPIPGKPCRDAPVQSTLLDATAETVTLAVGADLIEVRTAPDGMAARTVSDLPSHDRVLGTSRSPDASAWVSAAPTGWFLRTATGSKLVTGIDPHQSHGCVPSNGGTRLSCVVGRSAVIYEVP